MTELNIIQPAGVYHTTHSIHYRYHPYPTPRLLQHIILNLHLHPEQIKALYSTNLSTNLDFFLSLSPNQ